MGKVKSHECVAWLQHCEQYGGIGLCARVWLHVGIFGSEEFAHTVDGKLFHFVNHLASTIVSLSGITLSILVGEVGAHGFHYLVANKIFGRNEFNAFQLSLMLTFDKVKNLLISFHFKYFIN